MYLTMVISSPLLESVHYYAVEHGGHGWRAWREGMEGGHGGRAWMKGMDGGEWRE
jgi:hypothetical protein